jgi:hypothetical protein
MLALVLAASAATVVTSVTEAHGACIGPISRSATFTYTDRSGYIQSGTPIRYAKIKVTASVCHDSQGNVWAAALPNYSIPAGSTGFLGVSSRDSVAITHGVRCRLHGTFRATAALSFLLHVRPYLQATESNGVLSWSKGDLGPYFSDGSGAIIHDYDPVTWTSAWN